MDNEINITYETLFDLLRREKGREELQALDKNFNAQVVKYLQEKMQLLTNEFSEEEKSQAAIQINNIKKILKELYDRREKKILNMAIHNSREPSSLIDTSVMLQNESALYDKTSEVFTKFRENILTNMMDAKPIETPKVDTHVETHEVNPTTKMLRFIHAVPKFLGRELEIFGPFEKEDIATLPTDIAA